MPWTNLPADQTTDWSHVDFLNQFVDAYNERANLIIPSGATKHPAWFYPVPFDSFEAGDDVSGTGANSLRDMQERLEFLMKFFGDPTLFPVGLQTTINENGTSFGQSVGAFDLADWRSAAGLHVDGFTRKYPREIASLAAAGSNGQRARYLGDAKAYEHTGASWMLSLDQASPVDTLTANGWMEAGDYIGPWIFNELQAGIQALHTIRVPVADASLLGIPASILPQHYGEEVTSATVATPELAAADAYAKAIPGWAADPFITLSGHSNYFRYRKQSGTGSLWRLDLRAFMSKLQLRWGGVLGDDLTRTLVGLYFWPGSGNSVQAFFDFDTGMIDAWNDITGDYDPEIPVTGNDWDCSEQWPFANAQNAICSDPVAALGWPYTSGSPDASADYVLDYYQAGRASFAGYIQFSGFEYP